MDTNLNIQLQPLPTCSRCQGSLVLDQEQDIVAGIAMTVFLCINCGCRRPITKHPIPLYRN